MTANRGREAVVAVAGLEANAGTNAGTEARGLAMPVSRCGHFCSSADAGLNIKVVVSWGGAYSFPVF
jgi:hypothetical protein